MAPDLDQLATALDTALRAVLDPEEYDVTRGAAGELDLSTDDWTLHLEGWPTGPAWLAIDDEPDDPSRYDAARRAVMSEAVERALAEADRAVDGALVRALQAGGDPFSIDLALALASG
ncbi:MAG TPA: hypothetical protein VKB09_16430 [Thermomicrobiales bacterium]|nr:hypothetical protein [Thermomicrobiales bacterium]